MYLQIKCPDGLSGVGAQSCFQEMNWGLLGGCGQEGDSERTVVLISGSSKCFHFTRA